jgi:two-component system, chemotaxis family, response regulator Rcp1
MTRTIVGRSMEILLVEDNLEDARVTIQALTRKNVRCRVTLVRDGAEAMSFMHREAIFARAPRPDLVLLDMELPKKDGSQVLAELRADDELKNIPVVVLTGSQVQKAVLQAQQLHVDGFISKPVDWDQFIAVVQSLRRSWLADAILPAVE